MTERVYLHIGPPKTGTSYVQQALWGGRGALAAAGVLVPGDSENAHRLAAWDFVGRRPQGADLPAASGSWQRLVDEVRAFEGAAAVVSEESLAAARAREVRRLVRAFAPAQVHVVVTARDLGRVIPAAWQQRVQGGETQPWPDFVAELRDPEQAGPPALLFWLRQDLAQVLRGWKDAVPPDQIHIVTVPPAGSPPRLLLDRFTEATGLDPGTLQAGEAPTNLALGMVQAEVLRRLNVGLGAHLGAHLGERQYRRVVHSTVVPALRARPGQDRIALPAGHQTWVRDRSRELIAELAARGYPVSGDLDDLLGAPERDEPAVQPPDLADPASDALLAALTAVTADHARLWSRHRRGDRNPATGGAAAGLASRAKDAPFRLKSAVLRAARHDPRLARVARAYLRRRSDSSG